jgi:hypothetical protein
VSVSSHGLPNRDGTERQRRSGYDTAMARALSLPQLAAHDSSQGNAMQKTPKSRQNIDDFSTNQT